VRSLDVLVEFLVKPSFITQFRDPIAANAKASPEREIGCKRFDVLATPEEPPHFALNEIYEDEAAFDDHLVSSHCLSFTDAIENQIEERSVRRWPSAGRRRRAMRVPRDCGAAERRPDTPTSMG
jgi:(4S)-4-hydroxy-5-phosphonooxypentane-2,3-dione isomerase